MRLVVLPVGRLKAGPERELAERYCERAEKAGRAIGVKTVDVIEIDESRARRPSERRSVEGAALKAAVPKDAVIVVLDGSGQALSSEAFASRLGRWRDAGRAAVCFIIGGADGLDPNVCKNADFTLSFGAATWPHQLVRIMLFEQLYRAVTILCGHPYHRS